MSKVSDEKTKRGYREKPDTCANCEYLDSEIMLPAWMAERNKRDLEQGRWPSYDIEKHGVEKKLRCSSGGFAVKKMATCDYHKRKEEE